MRTRLNAVSYMYKRTIICVERNGGHVEGMVRNFTFHINKQASFICAIVFVKLFDEGNSKMKILAPLMLSSSV